VAYVCAKPVPAAEYPPQMNADPDNDPLAHAFRLAMRATAQAVSIAACLDPASGRRLGLTVSSFTSVSMEPPTVLACINKASSMAVALRPGLRLSFNLLAETQAAISNAFATEPEPADRFLHGGWKALDDGTPVLADSLGLIHGEVKQLIEWGSHWITICAVLDATSKPEARPLRYHGSQYCRLGGPLD
jgi:flavin reductase